MERSKLVRPTTLLLLNILAALLYVTIAYGIHLSFRQ